MAINVGRQTERSAYCNENLGIRDQIDLLPMDRFEHTTWVRILKNAIDTRSGIKIE
jgi:hypothetical protein